MIESALFDGFRRRLTLDPCWIYFILMYQFFFSSSAAFAASMAKRYCFLFSAISNREGIFGTHPHAQSGAGLCLDAISLAGFDSGSTESMIPSQQSCFIEL
jgi:hypothetical protein